MVGENTLCWYYKAKAGRLLYRATTDQARQAARWLGLVACDPNPADLRWVTWRAISDCGNLFIADDAR